MSYTVTYDEECDCILVSVAGEFNLPLLEKIATDVEKIEKKHGCKRIINNLLEAKLADGALEVYKMPEKAKQMGVDYTYKRALVVGDRFLDFYFLETVFVNQGHLVKMFATFDEAKEWLAQN
ncbi:MAG: hypothetical protein GXO74_14310 [Calditrichaeota bacterium]|nr:hypothetical protein [Calditrichota bacterium]